MLPIALARITLNTAVGGDARKMSSIAPIGNLELVKLVFCKSELNWPPREPEEQKKSYVS